MIDEMRAAFRDAWVRSMASDPRTEDPEGIADAAGIEAVLALVEHDTVRPMELRIADLERQLDAQRGLTADAVNRAMRMDAELIEAHGRIADLEERLATMPVADHG